MRRKNADRSMHYVDVHVGAQLRSGRCLIGLSQTDVADGIGVTYQQVQKYECGVNRISAGTLFALAKLLKVSVDYFFEGLESPATSLVDDESTRGMLAMFQHYKSLPPGARAKLREIVRIMAQIEPPAMAAE